MTNLSEKQSLYLRGTIFLIVLSFFSFFGLNLLPISYSFRFFEVFGYIMFILLGILGIQPKFLNENKTKN